MAKKKTEYFDIMSPRARLSYPHLDKVETFKEEDGTIKPGKFTATLLFCIKGKDAGGKGVVDIKPLQKAMVQAAESMFGPRADWSPKMKKNFKWPIKKGDDELQDGEIPEGYANHVFIKAGSKDQPALFDIKRRPIEFSNKEDPKKLYAGCFVRASLTAAAFDVDGGRGVTFYLKGIQKLDEGPAFSSRADVSNDFDDDVSEADESADEFDIDTDDGTSEGSEQDDASDDDDLDLSI